jgi:hypothetical protein
MAVLHEVYQRDDGLWQIGVDDSGPGPFESRAFAQSVASGHQPTPATPVKFRRIKIKEARSNVASS